VGAGFAAHNMAGGLLEWSSAGLPLEPEDGYVA
jgi:rhodanese-related sulfurtransferase